MQFRTKVLRGPNLWATFAVLEVRVDFSEYPSLTDADVRRMADALENSFPGISELLPLSAAGGWQAASLLQQLVQRLQLLAGTEQHACRFGRVATTKETTAYRVVVQFQDEPLAVECVNVAVELFVAALRGEVFDAATFNAAAAVRKARTAADLAVEETSLSLSARALCRAAEQRGIPALRLGQGNLVQLGFGARAQRLQGTQTLRTGAIAESIAAQPALATHLLRTCGLPTIEATAAAVTHRLLVVGDRVVAAVRLGEGVKDSESNGHAANGPTPIASPTPCSCRGQATDVFQELHADLQDLAVEAARIVGLDVAGVTIVTGEVSRPFQVPAEGIVAIQASPDLASFVTAGEAHSVQRGANAILETMFPAGQNGRIPLVAITGVNGKTTTTRLIAHIVGTNGRKVGMTCTEGIFIGERRIDRDDCSGPASARAVLMNPQVEAAVLETARGGILRAGLGFDQCDVAVVTNIAEGDHLGLNEIDTPEELAEVKQVIVRAVAPSGTAVLKADDPLVAAMAAHCPGSVVFFCRDPEHPVVVAHRARGGGAVFVRGQHIAMAEGEQEFSLLSLERVPLTHEGKIGFQVENALAASAAAWALGVPCELIRKGLEEFSASMEKIPGRFNLVEIGGATVIFDYGHNPSSLKALLEALDQFPQQRRLAVYTAAGDRRDCDMVRQGELLGEAFDRVVLYEDQYMRGRQAGEIMALLKRGLLSARRVKDIDEMQGWIPALELALQKLQPGDLLLVQADTIDQTVQYVRDYLRGHEACREIQLSEASLEQFRNTGKTLREMSEAGQGIWKF